MATSEIKKKISLATAGIKDGLTKAKAGVTDFTVTAKSKFASLKKSFGGLGGILSGAVVGGFAAAAKSTLNYAKEVSNLSAIAGISVEQFQKLAFGAKSVGVENDKLADIFKDVNDKLNDFQQAGSGPFKDFFEYIGPAVGVTADAFKDLTGPQALQLYYDSLQKANLNHEEMTFYMEAIANDATVLIPLLKDGGKAWKSYADEAERAGLVMEKNTIEQLKLAQFELDKISAQGTIAVGKLVAVLNDAEWYERMVPPILLAQQAWGKFADFAGMRAKELSKTEIKAYEETVAELKKLREERTKNAEKGIKIVTEAEKKANIAAAKEAVALGKIDEKIYAEREKRHKKTLTTEGLLKKAIEDRTAAEALYNFPFQTAIQKKENLLKLEKSITAEVEARAKHSAEEEKIRQKIFDTLDETAKKLKDQQDERKEAAEEAAQAAAEAAKAQEEARQEAIESTRKQLELEVELAEAEGDPNRIAAAREALDIENQMVRLMEQHNLSEQEALEIISKQQEQKQKMIDMERDLLNAVLSGDEIAARAAQKKIDLEQRAMEIMQQLKVSYEEAYAIAQKLARIEAGPDLNDSGFTTRFEQREFNRQQKQRDKALDNARKQEERDQRDQGGWIPNVSKERRKTDFGKVNMLIDKDETARRAENKKIGNMVRGGMDRAEAEAQFAAARAQRARGIDEARAAQKKFGIQDPKIKAKEEADAKAKADWEKEFDDMKDKGGLGPDGKQPGPDGKQPGPDGKQPEPKKPDQAIAEGLQAQAGKLDEQIAILTEISASLKC